MPANALRLEDSQAIDCRQFSRDAQKTLLRGDAKVRMTTCAQAHTHTHTHAHTHTHTQRERERERETHAYTQHTRQTLYHEV